MTYPVFSVPAGDVIPIFFSSYDGGTGASITLTGLLASDVEIYKDGSVTQRASDAGYTLLDTDGIDFDGITGIHGFSIDTGDNTDAGFYTVGAWFTVVVSSVTVDGQTVNFIAAQFRLMAAESVAAKPKVDVDAWLGTAAATPSVAGVPEVDLTHVAGATTNVAALATNVDAILTDTGTTLQAELDGIQADTEDIQSRLPAALVGGRIDATVDATGMEAGAVAAIADGVWDEAATGHTDAGKAGEQLWTDLDAVLVDTGTTLQGELDGIQADTEDIQTRLPAALVGGRIDATVDGTGLEAAALALINAEVDTALADYDGPTRAEATADKDEILAYLNGLVIAKGTIGSTGNSTTALHLTGLTYGDDEINNYLIAIRDVSASEWHARYIEDWADTGDLATVATLPFTPENAVDTYVILAFRQDVTGGSGLDAAGVRAAIGLAAANLDTQLSTIDGNVDLILADTGTDGVVVASIAANAINAAAIANGAIDAATFAADVDAEILSYLVDDATRIDASALNTASGATIPEIHSLVDAVLALQRVAVDPGSEIGDTGNDTTHLHLSNLTYGDDECNDMMLIVYDNSEDEYHSRWITDWVNATKLATLHEALPFTPEDSVDTYWIVNTARQDVTGGSGLDAAGVRAAIGLSAANLDTQLDALPTAAENATAAWAAGTRTLTAIDEDSTTLDLDATIRGAVGMASADLDTQLGALPTAAENADAVWDEDATAHQTGGTFGQAIGDPGANTETIYDAVVTDAAGTNVAADIIALKAETALILEDTGTTLPAALTAIDDFIDTEVAAILADTNELQGDWTNGGRLDLLIDAIKAKTDSLTFTTANQVDAQVLSLATGAITAGSIAADAIGASELAADAATEIATAVWASATRTLSALGFTLSAADLAADTIGASELAADAITEIVNAVLTTAMTESYNADGAAPTLAQAMFVTMQRLTEFAISGTTISVKGLDGATTKYTLTLDDADSPSSSTRAT